MVVNFIIAQKLMKLGLSEYEGKAYLSLLHESPATAYEIGKASGIPTSKVYEVLTKLVQKDIVSVLDQGRSKQYMPLAPDELLARHLHETERTIDSVRGDLEEAKAEHGLLSPWNTGDYDYLIYKVGKAVQGASKTVLLSVWAKELAFLEGNLRDALKRKVKIAVVHFGTPKIKIGQMYPHPVENSLYHEKKGRGLVAVIDSREMFAGFIAGGDRADGMWSMNSGFVTLAEDYIRHDIYVMKIMKRFDRLLREKFGSGYARMRDIFTDEDEH